MPSPLQGGVPWLVYPFQGHRCGKQKFYSLIDGRLEYRCNKLLQDSICIASAKSWMLIKRFESPLIVTLFNPFSSQHFNLPKLETENPIIMHIVSDPSKKDCFVVGIYKDEHLYILYTSPGEKSWIKYNLDVWDDKYNFTMGVASYHDKIYILISDYTLVVIEFIPHLVVKKFNTKTPDGYLSKMTFQISSNLMESSGKLFLVKTILYANPNPSSPRTMIVYKLDFSTMTWNLVETLNEDIFILSGFFSFSFMSSNTKLKRNCIYTVRENVLYGFDMEYRSLTVSYPLSDSAYNVCGPFWLTAPDHPQMKMKMNYTRVDTPSFSCSYEKLHFDHPKFLPLPSPSTCNIIRSSNFCPRWHSRTPWLMFAHKDNGVYKLLDPSTKSTYQVLLPGLSGCMILASVDGWLFAQVSSLDFCFLNPFSKEKINLPRSNFPNPNCVAFSASPTNSECKIFLFHSAYTKTKVKICTHRIGDKAWTYSEFDVSPTFKLAQSNAVYLSGRFYCLGMNGHLGVYDPIEDSWVVYNAYVNVKVEARYHALVESQGKLLSVFIDLFRRPVGVFEFDMNYCRWKRLAGIGDRTFFFGQGASYCVTSHDESMKNMLYLSLFYKQGSLDLVTYPLSSIGSLSSTFPSANPKIEYVHVWIEPRGSLCGLCKQCRSGGTLP